MDNCDQLTHRLFAHRLNGRAHGSQRRRHQAGKRHVVEADNRDIVGHLLASLAQRHDAAAGSLVVAGENSVELHAAAQPLLDRDPCLHVVEVAAAYQLRIEGNAVSLQRLTVAKLAPIGVFIATRTGQVGDPPAAVDGDQVLHQTPPRRACSRR